MERKRLKVEHNIVYKGQDILVEEALDQYQYSINVNYQKPVNITIKVTDKTRAYIEIDNSFDRYYSVGNFSLHKDILTMMILKARVNVDLLLLDTFINDKL